MAWQPITLAAELPGKEDRGGLRGGDLVGRCLLPGEDTGNQSVRFALTMQGSDGACQGSSDEKGTNLWNLLPSFDPSLDTAKEYADKVCFLW